MPDEAINPERRCQPIDDEEQQDRCELLMRRITDEGYIPTEEEYSLLKRAGYLRY